MSNEYDYSGLYNNTSGSGQPNGQNPQPEQSAPAQNQQPQQSSYPNVVKKYKSLSKRSTFHVQK